MFNDQSLIGTVTKVREDVNLVTVEMLDGATSSATWMPSGRPDIGGVVQLKPADSGGYAAVGKNAIRPSPPPAQPRPKPKVPEAPEDKAGLIALLDASLLLTLDPTAKLDQAYSYNPFYQGPKIFQRESGISSDVFATYYGFATYGNPSPALFTRDQDGLNDGLGLAEPESQKRLLPTSWKSLFSQETDIVFLFNRRFELADVGGSAVRHSYELEGVNEDFVTGLLRLKSKVVLVASNKIVFTNVLFQNLAHKDLCMTSTLPDVLTGRMYGGGGFMTATSEEEEFFRSADPFFGFAGYSGNTPDTRELKRNGIYDDIVPHGIAGRQAYASYFDVLLPSLMSNSGIDFEYSTVEKIGEPESDVLYIMPPISAIFNFAREENGGFVYAKEENGALKRDEYGDLIHVSVLEDEDLDTGYDGSPLDLDISVVNLARFTKAASKVTYCVTIGEAVNQVHFPGAGDSNAEQFNGTNGIALLLEKLLPEVKMKQDLMSTSLDIAMARSKASVSHSNRLELDSSEVKKHTNSYFTEGVEDSQALLYDNEDRIMAAVFLPGELV